MPAQYSPDVRRFWSKVDRSGGSASCWPWLGYRNPRGYGVTGGRLAHRIAWALTHGSIPPGMHVCHDCPGGDNPACCNPAHLFLGTPQENGRDAAIKRRRPRKLTPRMVLEIRRLGAEGWTQRAIAARFEISPSLVHDIRAGRKWAHVQDVAAAKVTGL